MTLRPRSVTKHATFLHGDELLADLKTRLTVPTASFRPISGTSQPGLPFSLRYRSERPVYRLVGAVMLSVR